MRWARDHVKVDPHPLILLQGFPSSCHILQPPKRISMFLQPVLAGGNEKFTYTLAAITATHVLKIPLLLVADQNKCS
jgi:hypothetical protein